MDQIMSLPFGVALAALFAIVMIRVNVTYWIGRGAVAGFAHTRFGNSLERPKAARAQALIQRWGPYAVVLSFLTVGLQTAINLAAGAARMPLRRYLPAAVIGSVVWALLYATIGLAALEAWLAVAAASPVGAALGAAALAAVVVWFVVFRRRRAAAKSADTVV
ncbi:VTT domain-containing protein [Paenarthrobacter nitroguajacolicus]|uniref:DedA family protein n=1 Tax=Paenarthrobacter nitroguajacolicus TaxID=211146 RepID=UPI0028642955|nr:VTT domain-containing protein [Paenarthrobacter nitroguajacolicus]MDR6636494.1 membrane protein DedA with SNARE-associated domain [Paenarthrobacter nitroguajacolicus]